MDELEVWYSTAYPKERERIHRAIKNSINRLKRIVSDKEAQLLQKIGAKKDYLSVTQWKKEMRDLQHMEYEKIKAEREIERISKKLQEPLKITQKRVDTRNK